MVVAVVVLEAGVEHVAVDVDVHDVVVFVVIVVVLLVAAVVFYWCCRCGCCRCECLVSLLLRIVVKPSPSGNITTFCGCAVARRDKRQD